jgi:hypothetical protein
MIVGREHIIHPGGRDYDELMEMGADPAPHPAALPPAPQHALHPHHGHGHHPHPAHHPHHPHHAYAPPVHYVEPHYDSHHHHPIAPSYASSHGREGLRIEKKVPHDRRQFPIGFRLDDVAAGDERDIEVKPQVLFRGERLAIAQSIARYFDVLDIKVGKDSQLAATGALTGEAFETRAVGVRMELDTAEPGITIVLRVKNTDTAAHDFKAVLYGTVLE